MHDTKGDALRAIPSVESALKHLSSSGLGGGHARSMLTRSVQRVIANARVSIQSGEHTYGSSFEEMRLAILADVEREVKTLDLRALMPVLNATGVILHTNLGRSPLAEAALEAITETAGAYSNLEFDLVQGTRGKRDLLVLDALCVLTGAEDALVVNNNAAAVLLAINTLALGREVIVSRGELIEIGGSFRLPEVFERGGATMVEVGTTNRTSLADFEDALNRRTGALLSAHWSNYSIEGFVERVDIRDLTRLGDRWGIPVIHDLGSGALVDSDVLRMPGEMTVGESVSSGADVVTFSGDKMLGGPQAGIAVGKADTIARMRKNPLMRALRPGKQTLAALQATLGLYLEGTQSTEIPVLRMMAVSVEELRARSGDAALRLKASVGDKAVVKVCELTARVGGGAVPGSEIPSIGLELTGLRSSAGALSQRLRSGCPPVVGRTTGESVLLDLRTVPKEQDSVLIDAVLEAVIDNA